MRLPCWIVLLTPTSHHVVHAWMGTAPMRRPWRRTRESVVHPARVPSAVSMSNPEASLETTGLENTATLSARSDGREIVSHWMQAFQRALASNDAAALSTLFTATPYWRDMVALTWNIITLHGHDEIAACVAHLHAHAPNACTDWEWHLDDNAPSPELVSFDPNNTRRFDAWVNIATRVGQGRAHVRLQLDNGTDTVWKASTLLTTLQSLDALPWRVAPLHRPRHASASTLSVPLHTLQLNRRYWHDRNDATKDDPYVVIIGGGQGGVSLAARLHTLGVPYLVVEAGAAPGGSWRRRYPSLVLHDPVVYNHLPYLPFPVTWPTYCPRDKIAAWLAHYASALDLHVTCRTRVTRATQCKDMGWTVHLESTHDTDGPPLPRTIQCRHVVFATGNSSHPQRPTIPGSLAGTSLHSASYQGGRAYAALAPRHAVVIGSNNSAFDICQDLWEQLSRNAGGTLETITMIQRSPAMVVSADSVLRLGLGPLYSEDAVLSHEEADLVATTVPYQMAKSRWKDVTDQMLYNDATMLEGLTRAGYRLDTGPDGTGIFAKSATQGGGFYINVGGAELITEGHVAVRYATVERFENDSVVVRHIDDGREERLPADLVIYATGFATMETWVSDVCGPDVAHQMGRTWGLGWGTDQDPGPWRGELRNMWKPTNVEGLWCQGGNLAQNRHYSRFLALQLAARYLGLPTPVYGIPPPTPLARASQK